ncbi:phenolphthiocerol/phthiocerol polyketide synthase subunit C-like [Ruditapes philippinarum]|uniref:phenolphthiocerol/phthiocerol polyketide synthase subunit C-like n=1 Tax=Ruditapes philippinarum TaxID=129788 RepID=UPI00295BE61C|nr:phenolphthiocerol/phthiocerol polyketide synthase subunit C-like [Ruditapes philippinarum]
MGEVEEIAIVGVGCRFPGADNIKEYWDVLKNGENHVKEVPRDRWNIDVFYDPDRNKTGKTYVRTAGFIKSIDEWDHRCYGINDMEAELVDPQQRIVLDCVHMALEDGGITRQDIDGTQTGVYIGSMTDDYKGFVMDDSSKSSTYSVTGTQNSVISARVSYTYNLLGPSITLDTACSSSLVAIDVASQALITGKCSMAICGGVNILMDPQLFVALSKAGMLSPTGQCQTFTKDADGYARGEGCGIVILKTLKNAITDGNKIWGTLRTETNQDGHMASPITAPSGLQQEKLIKKIFERYGIAKDRISVIEAHGTGTAIGDPTEVNALGTQFGKSANAKNEVFIASVKTNIGHLEAAAGVAGLIKVLLMMKYDMIVPSLWYTKENENPLIRLSQHGFVVPTKCTNWKRVGNENRLACVNSFGFGGTNAHCIVEEYIQKSKQVHNIESCLPFVIAITAYSKESLFTNVQHLYDALKQQTYDISAVSYTSTYKREHRPYRKAIFGNSQDGIISAAGSFLTESGKVFPSKDATKVVFVFCGVGTAWKGMCSSLMNLKVFKDTLCSIDKHLKPLSGWNISSKLIDSYDILTYPMISHIAIFACQIGLASLWKELGIVPDVVVGQSVGEVAAAYIAGYFDLQTAVQIIFYRSKLLAAVTTGTMAVIRNVEVDVVEKYCKTLGSVTVAVYNSQDSCTVSGMAEDIQTLKHNLSTSECIKPQFIDLNVQCAYHSKYVDQAAKDLEKHLHNNQYRKAHTPMLSTVTGKLETNGLFATPNYWGKNVKMPVLFSDAIKAVESKTDHNIFLEIGPSPVLRAHIEKIVVERNNYTLIPSMQKNDETKTFTEALCTLFELGLTLKWTNIYPYRSHVTDIPTYQFRKFHTLYQSPTAVKKNQGIDTTDVEHLYVKQLPQKEESFHFNVEISESTTPFVFQHIVTGLVILPGAVYADVGFEIGSNVYGLSKQNVLVSLEFLRPVRIEPGTKTILHVSTVAQRNELLFHAKYNHVTMCKGWIKSAEGPCESQKTFDIECMKLSISSCGCKHMSEYDMYENLESMGFKYGNYFTVMKSCITNGIESLTEVEIPDEIVCQYEMTTLHPCVLDGMMQSTINTTPEEILVKIRNEKLTFMPVAIGELRLFGKPEKKMYVFTRRFNTTVLDSVLQVHYNILLLSKNGAVLADLRNYTTYGKRNASIAPRELSYRLTWHPFENKIQQKNQPTNVLVLTNTPSKHVCLEFDEFKNVLVYQNDQDVSNEEFISNAIHQDGISREIHAVVLLVEKHGQNSNINALSAPHIHERVRNNCMLLTAIVKFMTNENIAVPLYVVTQNTQPTFSNESSKINIVGEELWGFTRSIHLEFIHGDITLIDLQPSIQETKHTLVSFVNDTCNNMNHTKPEIIINYDKIYGAQFTKVPRKEIIPTLRLENTISRKIHSSHKVLADRSKRIESLVITKSKENEDISKKHHISVLIKSVCLHPVSIYPRTTSGINLDQDIWKECLDDGHHLYGLEYTGIPLSGIVNGRTSSKRPEVNAFEQKDCFNKWEILTIFPSEISTKMSVPETCTVQMKDIPFYQPGLVLTTVLSWNLTKDIPSRATVVVYSCQESSMSKLILETLLQTQNNAILVDLLNYQDNNKGNIDVLVTLEKLDLTLPVLGRCKKIICLQGCVSELVRLKASRSGKQTIATFTALELIEKNVVSKCLPKIICWLQRNYKRLVISEHSCSADDYCNVPFPSLEIINDSNAILPIRNPIDCLFSKSAIYIVTGGMTGLGWEIIRLLAEMGAGFIGSISRRDHSADKADDIDKVEKATGCKIIQVKGDVSDLKSISRAIKELESYAKNGSIRGVFHGAGVLNSKLLMNLEESQLDFVLRPKVIGTMNMHIVTKDMDLDYFVVASSINSLIGSPGQSSYGAANSFLDTFMEWRRQHGLPGQAINWGALCVGMASRPEFVESFTKRGFNLLSILEIRSCFQDALMRNTSSIIYTDINWDICAKDYTNPKLERTRLQMTVLIEEAVSHSMHFDNDGIEAMSFDINALRNVGTERQLVAFTQVILKVSRKVIGGDLSQIRISSTLAEMAFDSMSTVTFINIVHDITGFRIPPAFMLNMNNSLNSVVQLLFQEIFADKACHSESIEHESNKTNKLHEIEPSKDGNMTPIET